ncbi:hypothetical protein LXH13_03215 [Streptomyces spinosirectus]|jgi:hypothetical protein|nr:MULTISPECIES: hypothetical protein [Streptomyces]MBY8339371.1 hypothetical protein [Streptomyces plumbidurans]PTM93097.1 hypothetical protein C7821_108225 [Streptomyces sp. VMFN-G11Ma]UIR16096.1 hypothetical protein LXH13_03215 [Streptomyces spinosirectus]
MTTHRPTRRTTRLRKALAALLREPRSPGDPDGTPDVWLAALRLGG